MNIFVKSDIHILFEKWLLFFLNMHASHQFMISVHSVEMEVIKFTFVMSQIKNDIHFADYFFVVEILWRITILHTYINVKFPEWCFKKHDNDCDVHEKLQKLINTFPVGFDLSQLVSCFVVLGKDVMCH